MPSCDISCGTGMGNFPQPGDPDNNVVLSAQGAFGGIVVSWTYPETNPHAVAHVKLYRSTNIDPATKILHHVVSGSIFFDNIDLSASITYYYWIEIISVNGTVGELIGPASASLQPTVNQIIDSITGEVTESVLYAALRTRIDHIDTLDSNIAAEIIARVDNDNLLGEAISIAAADLENVDTLLQSEIIQRVDADSALVAQLDIVLAQSNGNLAAIAQEQQVRADADSALASDITVLQADVSDNTALITQEQQARADGDTALASDVQTLQTDVAGNTALIVSEQTARSDADTALASDISGLQTTVSNNTAAIATEQTARTDADTALASSITAVQATANAKNRTFIQATPPTADAVGDIWYDNDDENKPYRWDGADWINVEDPRIAANTASIITEQTARADADSALASSISTVQAIAVAKNRTFVQTSAPTADAVGDVWYDSDDGMRPYRWDGGNWIDAQDGAIAVNSASIVDEQTARADADSALASDITTLQTSVDGNTASIQTAQESVDGLHAQWTLKIDNNGHVSGFGLASEASDGQGGIVSDFLIAADRIGFVAPTIYWAVSTAINEGQYVTPSGEATGYLYKAQNSGTTGAVEPAWPTTVSSTVVDGDITFETVPINSSVPFVVDTATNAVYMDGAFIKDATIGTAQIDSILVDKITGIDASFLLANIGVGNLTNAYIGDTIQSANYPDSGWKLDKVNGIDIRDQNGNTILRTYTGGDTELHSAINNENQQWSQVSGTGKPQDYATKNTIYRQTEEPEGSDGDIWFDTDDNLLYRHNGSAWEVVGPASLGDLDGDANTKLDNVQEGATKNVIYRQTGAPGAGEVGDLWFDTDDDVLYRYNGSAWDVIGNNVTGTSQISDDANLGGTADWSGISNIPTGFVQTFYQSTSPATGMVSGDYWIDTDDNQLYRYNGSAWVSVQDSAIQTALSSVATAQATADGKIVTFAQGTAPTAEGIGDIWIDNDDNNKLYRWSGSAWVAVDDSRISQAITDASNAQATADGKIQSFYQTSAPVSGMDHGDLWIDTDNGNKLYRYNGSSWVDIQDSAITSAQSDASTAISGAATAQATADGKVATFFQTSAPTAEGTGDLWFDTDDDNKLYRWNGSSWAVAYDSRIAQALADASNAQAIADGKIQSFYQTGEPASGMGVGDIWIDTDNNNKIYRYNGSSWISVQDGTITAAQADASQAITDAATAQATADGKVTTFVQGTAPTAEGIGDIWIDTFNLNRLHRWSGVGWTAYPQEAANWNSVFGTGIPADNADVTGDTPQSPSWLTSPVVWSGNRISSANVGTYMNALAVDTLYLANQAVTIPVSAFTSSSIAINSTSVWATLQSLAFTSTGAPVFITCSTSVYSGGGGPFGVKFRIRRFKSGASTTVLTTDQGASNGGSAIFANRVEPRTLAVSDTPGAGAVTYYFEALRVPDNNTGMVGYSNSMLALEVKK
jgi:hypothetical protein